ncbi:MAG: DUF481 domain-containing protein [Chitinophagaceae bacterium]|nr:DUF481 domain-containing protein [Chitinophagaceae bacterium]MCW5929215.1 DUF481 domain-containing protein [Chitinophagaceae bacterium]
MRRVLLLLLTLCIIRVNVYAQFNDSTHHYLNVNFSGTLNRSPAAKTYLLNNGFKYSLNKKKTQLNFSNAWIYGQNSGKLTNNDYNGALDFNIFRDNKARLNYWGLAGFTSSYSLKILNQLQTGVGAAYKVVDKDYAMLRISDGILYENNSILLSDSTKQHYNTFRNSLRIQLRLYYKKIISFESTGFWQPSLEYKNDYIVNTQLALNIKLLQWLSLSTRYNYNRISRTDRENMLFTYGVLVEHYF